MSDQDDLKAFLDDAWQHLARGAADSRSPARYPTFATVSPDGMPEARTVALRAATRSTGVLEVHTDANTAKISALRQSPFGAFHIWLPRANLQIRAATAVEILMAEAAADQWARVPDASRVSYGTIPDPGRRIAAPFAYQKPVDPARFAVLRCKVTEIDLVHLGDRHRRAIFALADGWAGSWVAP